MAVEQWQVGDERVIAADGQWQGGGGGSVSGGGGGGGGGGVTGGMMQPLFSMQFDCKNLNYKLRRGIYNIFPILEALDLILFYRIMIYERIYI